MKELTSSIANGSVTYMDKTVSTTDIPWTPHAKFPGVALKHIIKGADTNNMLSCHMVRIDPDCMLDHHAHETQWEIHEVIEGEGRLFLDSVESAYHPGRIAVIPKGTRHKVLAGDSGMYMLVKFFPPLM